MCIDKVEMGLGGGCELVYVLMLCHLPRWCGVGVSSEVGGDGLVCVDLGVCGYVSRMCGSLQYALVP